MSKVRYGGDSDTDPRLVEYIEALKAYDIEALIELRLIHAEDAGLVLRFKTVEQVYANMLRVYEREIQILRMELDAWRTMDESRDRIEAEEADAAEKSAAKQCIYRAVTKLEKMQGYRRTQPEIDLPNSFT